MVEFGDHLLIDSYRIPWLIWIQFLVMFLLTLVILLSYFGLFALDSSHNHNADDPIVSSPLDPLSVCSRRSIQVSGECDSWEDAATSTSSRATEMENINIAAEREGSAKDFGVSAPGSERCLHPCHYFDLVKQAFLQCLGLGSLSRKFRTRRRRGHDD